MINIIRKGPGSVSPSSIRGVALSGGVDSMALISFLHNNQRHRSISAFFFDHNTETSKDARCFVMDYCDNNSIDLAIGNTNRQKIANESWEEYWREQRYGWLHNQELMIATAHHLNDVAETYIWSISHGHPRIIHYRKPSKENDNIIRPLLLTPKQELYDWCHRYKIPFIEDKSNKDLSFTRNRIRHEIMPQMLIVNPGFLKVMARKVNKKYENGYN